jgi:hypothetical protein
MSTERIIDSEKIHLVNIKTIKGNIDAASDIDTNATAGHKFSFELGTGLNLEDNVIGINLLVNIEAADNLDKLLPITGSYTHEIVFIVDNLKDFIEPDDNDTNKYKLDAGFGSTIVSIAYSTIRGIIFTRTQGTSLGSVILPVINPKKLMGLEL